MRSPITRRARFALVAAASLGLAACAADPQMQGAWDGLVTAMRNASAATQAAQADRSAAPAAVAERAATRPRVPDSAPGRSITAPAVAAANAAAAPAGQGASSPEIAALQRQLDELESRVAALTAENQRQMERLSLMTNGAIADMEQLFNSLRLELRSVPTPAPVPAPKRRRSGPTTGQAVPSGQGGPFLPWPPKPNALASGDRVEPLPDLQHLFLMHQIALALPLSAPIEDAVVTGPFGYRRDPFNHRSAFHDGIDLQAPMRSAVHAAAAGTVVVAGVRPAYGRVVEIDHGFGIRTRYAHLATLAVRAGDRVERHATVGTLGSSGRSASPHLHYEVLFNGRPHDPADLLKLAEAIRTLR